MNAEEVSVHAVAGFRGSESVEEGGPVAVGVPLVGGGVGEVADYGDYKVSCPYEFAGFG